MSTSTFLSVDGARWPLMPEGPSLCASRLLEGHDKAAHSLQPAGCPFQDGSVDKLIVDHGSRDYSGPQGVANERKPIGVSQKCYNRITN